jgi:hypothetical protein
MPLPNSGARFYPVVGEAESFRKFAVRDDRRRGITTDAGEYRCAWHGRPLSLVLLG